MKNIDLRSDTVTLPTEVMRQKMSEAVLGDDVYGEDPTINKLEEKGAAIIGKEASLFVPTGTMGNQICVMAHTNRGDEIILEEDSHIFVNEVGGTAVLAGVHTKTIKGSQGIITASDIEKAIRPEDIHFPETGLICLENTHNKAGGVVTPIEIMKDVKELGKEKGIPIHLDGARVFNAASYLDVNVKKITENVDTIMFCLSKGLGAPVGSLIAGSKEFIGKARKIRKILGGGMRQAGIIAAAGIVSLEKMIIRLKEDNQNARLLAEGLNEIDGINVDLSRVQTNIVFFDYEKTGYSGDEFLKELHNKGIKANKAYPKMRMVTHLGVSKNDIEYTISSIKEICENGK